MKIEHKIIFDSGKVLDLTEEEYNQLKMKMQDVPNFNPGYIPYHPYEFPFIYPQYPQWTFTDGSARTVYLQNSSNTKAEVIQ